MTTTQAASGICPSRAVWMTSVRPGTTPGALGGIRRWDASPDTDGPNAAKGSIALHGVGDSTRASPAVGRH